MNPWLINDTYELIKLVETIKQPARFLLDTFFTDKNQSVRDNFAIEYRKAGRVLAPFILEGINAKEVARVPHSSRLYSAPMIAARRTLTLNDLTERMFGEQPIFSSLTPEDRAAKLQAQDIVELLRMITNRQNAMAAELLQTGKVTVIGQLADGTEKTDKIDFNWDGALAVGTAWSDSTASIYDDLLHCSERIQEETGVIPTIAICGKNVEKYLIKNKEIKDWLMIPNRANLTMMDLSPHFTSPQVRFIGRIPALNLELVSYNETYTGADGKSYPFVREDTVIIGSPKIGVSQFGRVDFLDMTGDWQSAAANYVPLVLWNTEAQRSSITVFSRFIPIPYDVASWMTLEVSGEDGAADDTDDADDTGDDA
ncbi:MAG: major capsid protein [Selenomonadaceae bacterium]|nr:major capsid protein [Selenomonadaceae bacterium]